MSRSDKPLVWLAGEIKTPPLSGEARIEAGFLLRRLQRGEGLGLPHSRPMPSIGARCHELRITDRDQAWRIVYRADADAIVIVEVFSKKDAGDPSPRHRERDAEARRVRQDRVRMRMKAQKRARLSRAGWKIGGADDFLGLSKEEALLVEMKLDLAERLRELRANRKLSQAEVAKLLGSSQSRVAKMEAVDGSVTLDLLVRALLTIGLSKAEIARAMGGRSSRRAA